MQLLQSIPAQPACFVLLLRYLSVAALFQSAMTQHYSSRLRIASPHLQHVPSKCRRTAGSIKYRLGSGLTQGGGADVSSRVE